MRFIEMFVIWLTIQFVALGILFAVSINMHLDKSPRCQSLHQPIIMAAFLPLVEITFALSTPSSLIENCSDRQERLYPIESVGVR